MRTLNIKIKDEYFDKFVSFLELLPKKAIKIEEPVQKKNLDNIKKELKNAIKDIEKGHSNIIRVIELLAPETFVQLAGVNPYSQPKSIRTLSRRNFVQNGL